MKLKLHSLLIVHIASKTLILKRLSFLMLILCITVNAQSQCWRSISSESGKAVAIAGDGTLWAWGENNYGQVGDGTTVNKKSPTHIGTDNTWKKVVSYYYRTFAIKNDGSLWAWGSNSFGQIGDGTTINRTTPIRIGNDNNWDDLSAGMHVLALKKDGTLWAWGSNIYGQLGNGTTTDSNVPIQVGTDSDWSKVAAGGYHSLALKTDGSLWVWGCNSNGNLGDGTNNHKSIPTKLGTNTDWKEIFANVGSYAIKTNGTLWVWGYNPDGNLGLGDTLNRLSPTQVGTDTDWRYLSSSYHVLALKKNGTLWGWGWNKNGQLSDGTLLDKRLPFQIGKDSNWLMTSADTWASLALKNDGSLWTCGWNTYGILGLGNTVDKTTFTAVTCPAAINIYPPPSLSIDVTDTTSCSFSVDVPVRGKNLMNIFKLKGSIAWDTTYLTFGGVKFATKGIVLDSSKIDFSNVANGKMIYNWSDIIGHTAADSTPVFTLTFYPKNNFRGSTGVWFDTISTNPEIGIAIGVASTNTTFHNGWVLLSDTPRIVQVGGMLQCIAGCTPIHYQWYDNWVALSDTFNYITPVAGGDYVCTVTYLNGGDISSLPLHLVMPDSLISFNVQGFILYNTITWQIYSELNTAYFNIQRSNDGRNFINIGQVNSRGISNYSFKDQLNQPAIGTVYYRLKIVDLDGSFTYSVIKQLTPIYGAPSLYIASKDTTSCSFSVSVPVYGKNLINVFKLSGTIVWDTTILSYGFTTFSNNIGFSKYDLDTTQTIAGALGFNWSSNPYTVADSSPIFTITFYPHKITGGNYLVFDTSIYKLEIDTAWNVAAKNASFHYGYVVFNDTPKVVQVGTILQCFAGCAALHYQWYDNNGNPITGDTLNYITPTSGGSYTCSVTYINGNRISSLPTHFVLPVTLLSFKASPTHPKEGLSEQVLLSWVTATEINTAHFNIQRSTDGKDFVTVGSVNAKGAGSYNYIDNKLPEAKGNLYYRLQIVDKDGSKTYSDIRSVFITTDNSRFTITPNPARSFVTVSGSNIKQVCLQDFTGRTVISKAMNTNTINLSVNNLSKGIYLVKAILTDGSIKTEKLVVE